MIKKYYIIVLFVIFTTASILRLWQLGSIPPSPDWDEAAHGYNAYSILTTGKDEYGKFLPIVLQSFNDYKPALYTYLIIPLLLIFDVSVLAVRLPSAIFGILTVIAAYFFVKELFSLNSKFEIRNLKLEIALLAAGLLAISPWHIQFSRIGFEANVGLAFNTFMVLFFLKGLKNGKYLLLSGICAALSIYVYQSAKVFTPLFLVALILIFRKEVLTIQRKWIFISGIATILLAFPMVYYILITPDALMRARGVSIFHQDQIKILERTIDRLAIDTKNNDYIGLVFNNRRVVYAKTIVGNYLSHFNPNWLFIKGDSPRHHAPYMGLLYLVELPLILFGIYKLIFSEFDKKIKYVVFSQLLLSPVAASISFDIPSAVRTLNFLPTFQIFAAIGLIMAFLSISKIKYQIRFNRIQIAKIPIKYLTFTLCTLFFIFNISYYLNQYFVQYNYFYSQYWQYGYKEATDEVKKIGSKYEKIVVSNKVPLDQSYMFFLYYLKYSPKDYQEEKNNSGSFDSNHAFDKFIFRSIDWKNETKSLEILYVGLPSDFPPEAKVIKTINYLDGSPAMKIVEG